MVRFTALEERFLLLREAATTKKTDKICKGGWYEILKM